MRRSDADLSKEAIHEELTSLVANETCTLTELPPARKALTTTCVFKVKRDGGGDVDRYKARLCVRGLEQREGFDYQELFAPTSGKVTQRVNLCSLEGLRNQAGGHQNCLLQCKIA